MQTSIICDTIYITFKKLCILGIVKIEPDAYISFIKITHTLKLTFPALQFFICLIQIHPNSYIIFLNA